MSESREATITLANKAGSKVSKVTPKQFAFLEGYIAGLQAVDKMAAERNREDKKDGDNQGSSINDPDQG